MSTQKDILELILTEIATMKTKLPNGELKRMEEAIHDLRDNYTTLKEDVSDIKYTLLNPEDGIIVRVNKNSEYRKEREAKQLYYDKIVTEFEKMRDWKDGVTKALWIVFTTLIGIVGYILSGVMPH
jgi:predicted  nucleic acid-binding Zn-ribbon protein